MKNFAFGKFHSLKDVQGVRHTRSEVPVSAPKLLGLGDRLIVERGIGGMRCNARAGYERCGRLKPPLFLEARFNAVTHGVAWCAGVFSYASPSNRRRFDL